MTPEQQGLLEKASRSLQAAKLLNEAGLAEFSAARAYYTMFYVAEAFLEGKGLSFSSHSAVISAFGQHFARTGRIPTEFHRNLLNAQDSRNQGDYNIDPNLTQADAALLIDRAEQFLKFAQQQIDFFPPL
jgi:uncharacterized protein (UPF0332 family)